MRYPQYDDLFAYINIQDLTKKSNLTDVKDLLKITNKIKKNNIGKPMMCS